MSVHPKLGVHAPRHRGRNHFWVEANRIVRTPNINYLNAWGCASVVAALALGYVQEVRDLVIVLINYELGKKLVIPYTTRFDEHYMYRVVRKLRRISYDSGLFMTLTIDPKRYQSYDRAITALVKSWNKLLVNIKKRYPLFAGYVRVIENQKSGNPHLHVMCFGVPYIAVDWIKELWDEHYNAGSIVNIKEIEDCQGAVRYLLKYFTKSFSQADDSESTTASNIQALLWATGRRQWSVSRSLISLTTAAD
jgi:hypothetical protein